LTGWALQQALVVKVTDPADAPGIEVVVFGRGNRPLRVAPNWTKFIDTAHVTLLPPVAVDIDFVVWAGDFETRRQVMQALLAMHQRRVTPKPKPVLSRLDLL